ncbi:28S ribosomal protein S14, mitochondrial-like isoform X5 [Varroa jacobsoni]|uniref:28S ribosomal protein S14, mitochondrial-like isoform X5 n=1 Tax=Varroa jacobsoni TaxID=62625 RepID=UPI000BFA60B0|nr:28S ribosomal protein S14, mitochondrial-like isoform X5 [Varroa jacobsoni]
MTTIHKNTEQYSLSEQMVKEYAFERLQYTAMKRNDILPKALQEVVSQELHAFPLNSCFTRMHNRCVLTSRARSVDVRYRMARMAWRHLADYNKLSGVQRAMWLRSLFVSFQQ